MNLEKQVAATLFEVIDPELGVNIMDLGLIYSIMVNENKDVTIRMTLTTPGCPMHDSITNGVKHRVSQLDSVNVVKVDLVWEPSWNPSKMSERAMEMLGM
ncbi:metal-sulfur cluster assembly factor [Virgibacillus halodenitrificans]|uniref:FeS assembly SUF system protein n=1 Tax=Virgibacillus halodenitrificans TaxID=1482 RepID=A0AAC9J0C6_VIRHA|nr:iron-sulfur cluster assembly protein [Virgibacillus halodenitrificans]APC47495.1 FeS assembly SUF system protein [Virgibacillus halodenitrificans]MCJ0932315.1 iron-sulfur cluster assembly protein [Virgibacillus halodenitrificans]WHX24690.1 iron-sulfur cluster assembly protein [Virgibacillus halodenitrificans]